MKQLVSFFVAASIAGPALAQHVDHDQAQDLQAEDPPAAAASSANAGECAPEHAAMGRCTMAPEEAVPAPTCLPEHAAIGHCTLTARPPSPSGQTMDDDAELGALAPEADPHAFHQPSVPAQGSDPHAGHQMPTQQVDPHAGHQQPASPLPADPHASHGAGQGQNALPPIAPPPPEALTGPAYAQDLFSDPAAAARSRAELTQAHGNLKAYRLLIDQLEAAIGDGEDGFAWDAQFWYGGDFDKLWLKSEGEGEFGSGLGTAEVQALWSHAIGPWFDLQTGVRQDLRSGADRTHLVLGAQGLAPYWFEIDGALFLSMKGDVTGRLEAEYDLRLTHALILQPRAEIDISLQDVPELGLGSGPTTGEIGVRLRHEFYPSSGAAVVAPYIGVQYEQAFGQTADFRRAAGEDVGSWSLLLGVRTWF